MHSRFFANTLAVVILVLVLLLALLLNGLRPPAEPPRVASEPLGWVVILPDSTR